MENRRPASARFRRSIRRVFWNLLFALLAVCIEETIVRADSIPQSTVSLKGQEWKYPKSEWRRLEEDVAITFDDFEEGVGSYELGPKFASRINVVRGKQHTSGGSAAIRIRGKSYINELDNTAAFYHKEDHDVSSYTGLRVQFYYITPLYFGYDIGESFILEASSNSGVDWTELQRWSLGDDNFQNRDKIYESDVTIKTSDIHFTENFRLRFRSDASSSTDHLHLDDIAFWGRKQVSHPTKSPSTVPTKHPSAAPLTESPTVATTAAPSHTPTKYPSAAPLTESPTVATTAAPSHTPTKYPSAAPLTESPTVATTVAPSHAPTKYPSAAPLTESPTVVTTMVPSHAPTISPSSPNALFTATMKDPSNLFIQTPAQLEDVTITFDDFENGTGSYKTGPTSAELYDPPLRGQHTPGGSTVMRIQKRRQRNDPDDTASFYHEDDHDVSKYSDLRIQFYFLTPRSRAYNRGESFIVEVSSNSGIDWIELQRWTMGDDGFEDVNEFYEGNVIIERSDVDFTKNFRLRFRSNASSDNDRLHVDDIKFSGRKQDIAVSPNQLHIPSLKPSTIPSVNPSSFAYPSNYPTRQPRTIPSLSPSRPPSSKPSKFPSQNPTLSIQPTTHPTDSSTLRPSTEKIGPFQMKLWWATNYRWQESTEETRWCMRCDSKSCTEDTNVEIKECKLDDRGQWWVKKGKKIMPYERQDLCVDYTKKLQIKIKECNVNSDHQKLSFDNITGFNTDENPFEVHPENNLLNRCLTQHHHPRRGEILKLQYCDVAYGDDSSFWSAASPPRWNGHS